MVMVEKGGAVGARVEESSHALRRITAAALPPQLPLLATLGGRPFGHLDPRWCISRSFLLWRPYPHAQVNGKMPVCFDSCKV
jgi:hypothetical protein